jgi:type II secretory pathway component PulF
METDPKILTEAMRASLAFAWANRDRATEHIREQILISLVGFGAIEEKAAAAEVLQNMRAERKSQFELDSILAVFQPKKPEAGTEGTN